YLCICVWLLTFFCSSRSRHTRSKRDWSSDVCSSDLIFPLLLLRRKRLMKDKIPLIQYKNKLRRVICRIYIQQCRNSRRFLSANQIGRASCRERVQETGM